jgi:tetratricopeptide (TPR) repeat protein
VAGASLIPILGRALSHLLQCSPDDLERQTIELAIDACLSASNFGDKRWKTVAVAYAEHMANQLGCAVIKGRVQLRTASLARLYPRDVPTPQGIYIPRINNRSNADFGKLKLLQARLQIDARSPTEEINETLNEFRAFSPISNLEESVQLEINFLRAKLQRYDGEFGRAKDTLVGFMEAVRYRASDMMAIHYYETVCEAGYPSNAIGHLEYEYGELLKKEQGQSGSGRRLRLALGGAYLMEALSNRPFNNDLLKKAEKLFQSIQWVAEPSMVTKHNFYVTKASLGMVHLLRSEWEESMKYWDEAFHAARDCFQRIGHAEMLIQYAQCEILHRLGRYSRAVVKGAAAREIFQECGRQYYFLGQGTAWLDRLDELAKEGGRPAIAARGSNRP